jgi:hypothetical protein
MPDHLRPESGAVWFHAAKGVFEEGDARLSVHVRRVPLAVSSPRCWPTCKECESMTRSVFYSFHYVPDNQRVAKIRNIGAIDDNKPAKDNDWETIKKGGDAAIRAWIDQQMRGRSCAVVMIGANTAGRKWINYEIAKAWDDKKGVVGIYINNLTNLVGETTGKGANPFNDIKIGGKSMNSIVKCYDPPYLTSPKVYNHIKENIAEWIEEAIIIRKLN